MGMGLSPRATGALVVAACAAFPLAEALGGARVVYWRDVHLLWLTQVDVLARTLAEGAWPVWDRFSGFGRPLLADPRAALFYPPTWAALLVRPGLAYAWLSAFHLFVGGLGTVMLARRLGTSGRAALVAGAAFTASGPFVSLVLMWHQLAAAAWAPWVIAAFHRLAEEPGRRSLAAAAALLGLQAVAGSPEYSAMTVLAVALVTMPRPAPTPAFALRAGGIGAGMLLGLGLAAVQWLPSAAYSAQAARHLRAPDARNWALSPPLLGELLLPLRATDVALTTAALEGLGGREPLLHSIYLGSPLLVLGLVGLTTGGAAGRLGGLGAAATLLALGSHTAVLPLLQALVPPLSSLRYPAKAFVFAVLALALLAGLGFDRVAQPGGPRRAVLAALAVLGLIGLAAVVPAELGWLLSAALQPLWRAAGLAAVLAAATAGLAARGAVPRWPPLLAALSVLPPLLHHRTLIETAPEWLFRVRPALLRGLDAASTGRLYAYDYLIVNEWQRLTSPHAPTALAVARRPLDLDDRAASVAAAHEILHPPTAARFGIAGSFDYDVLDFEPIERTELATFLRASEGSPHHLALLRLGAVRAAVGVGPAAWWRGLRLREQVQGLLRHPATLLEVTDPLPRAYAVGAVREAQAGALHSLVESDFDPRREVVLSPAGATTAGLPASLEPLRWDVRLTMLRGDRVELEVRLSRPGLVVLVDAWNAGWLATVDGRPAPVLAANVAFRAVPVPAGDHHVVMRYVSPGLFWGALCSAVAATVLVAAAWRPERER